MQAFRAATIPYDSLPARTDTAFFMRYAGLINGWGRCNRKFAYFAEIPLYLYGNREPTFRRSALNCRFTRNWLFRELGAFRGEQHFADIFDHMQERSVFKELGVNESASRFTRVFCAFHGTPYVWPEGAQSYTLDCPTPTPTPTPTPIPRSSPTPRPRPRPTSAPRP